MLNLPRIPEGLGTELTRYLHQVGALLETKVLGIQENKERLDNIRGPAVLRNTPNGIIIGKEERQEESDEGESLLLLATATGLWQGGTRKRKNTVPCKWHGQELTVQIFSPLSVDPNVRVGYVVPFIFDENGDPTATSTWGDGLIGDRKMVNLRIEEVPEVYPGWEVVIEAENQFMAFTGDVLALNDRHSGNVFDVFLPWDESTNPPSLRADIRDHPISLTGYTGTAKNVFATADDNEHFDESEYNAPTASPPPNITPPYLVSTLIERTS